MTENQIQVFVVHCAASVAELCADSMLEFGAFAIEERDTALGMELRAVMTTDENTLRAELMRHDENISVAVEWIDSEVLDSWKSHAQPVEVDDQTVIIPAWLDEIEGKDSIIIDTTDAFGIGDHPTTLCCARWLAARSLLGQSVLDIGCGTGVLAIIAAKRGASHIAAVDISDSALNTTRANAKRNNVTLDFCGGWSGLTNNGSFDVVIANILAPELISLAQRVSPLVNHAGTLLLAGLRQDQVGRVLAAYSDFAVQSTQDMDGWVMLELIRN